MPNLSSKCFLLLSVALTPCLVSAAIAPVGSSTASVPAGVATPVTFTATITDATVIGGSVNLLRIDSAGRATTVGVMHDDGLNGDAMAGDQIYSFQLNVFEQNTGTVNYRVSAAFPGSLLRQQSGVIPLTISGVSTSITITSPADSAYLNISPTTVSGTVGDPAATVTVNGISAQVTGSAFTATVPLQEGINTFTAVAHNSNSSVTTASKTATLDTTPPHISIDTPLNNAVTTSSTINVTGIVNDIVVGTVNNQQATVTVNGVSAQVSNRTYSAVNVPLSMGTNTIQATGRDRAGNFATASITVVRQPDTQPGLTIVSGNNLLGTIGSLLPTPLVVRLLDGAGHPITNTPVVFAVTGGNGTVSSTPSAGMSSAAVNTNTQGQAQVYFTLGSRAGAGNNAVTASSAGIASTAVFTETANSSAVASIVVDSGNNQSGVVGQAIPLPFIAITLDSGHNRLGNVPVTFTVTQGGGNFGGATTVTTTSDSDGRAAAILTLGAVAGQNVVTANFAGNTGLPATFTANGLVPGPPANTLISGVVLDNSNNPIAGVTMRLYQTNSGSNNNVPMQIGTPVQTNAQGFFQIAPAPVGVFKLMADGTTATTLGTFPTLEYDLVTVAGQNNTVGSPIFLPQISSASRLCVTATTGGTLTVPQAPGFSLTIAPGSATFPGGTQSGCVSVTPVNPDKIPMVPGFGQQPRFIVTIQPVGTTFNPPAAISIPNLDGLAPRTVTEMYSYDHDLATFTAIGTGTVSTDGSMIVSDPGVGVLKAGWHCGGDPNANGTVADCPTCKICRNNSCVADPAQDGNPCPLTGGTGACVNGKCQPIEYDPDTPITDSGTDFNGNSLYSIPLTKNNIGVSPGEKVIFNLFLGDTDRKRRRGTGPWTEFAGTGPYVVTLTISGPASWDSAASGTKTKTVNSLATGNLFLYADNPWPDAQPTITVTARVTDSAMPPAAPDVGTTRDRDFTITWTLVKRTQCPTTIMTDTTVGAAPNVFVPNPAVYGYNLGPALPPPLVFPYYQNQTILESFTAVSAYLFTLNDLLPAFKTANPTLTTPDMVAQFLFNGGNNGTFVIDNMDRIYDQHGRPPLQANVFTAAALTSGVGYNLPQIYSCGPNTVGNYTITTRYRGAAIDINKQGP